MSNLKNQIYILHKRKYFKTMFVLLFITFTISVSLNYFQNMEYITKEKEYYEIQYQNVLELKRSASIINSSEQNPQYTFLEEVTPVLIDLNINIEDVNKKIIAETKYLELLNNPYSSIIGRMSFIEDIDNKLILNSHLIENDIQAYTSPYELKLSNINIIFSDVFIVLIMLICIYLLIPLIIEDFEIGTYKTIYTSNVSKSKLIIMRILIHIISFILMIIIILFIYMFLIYLIFGIGDMNHPVILNNNFFTLLDYENNGGYYFVNLKDLLMIKLVLLSALIMFISTFYGLIASILRSYNYYFGALILSVVLIYGLNNLNTNRFIKYIPMISYDFNTLINGADINLIIYFIILLISTIFSFSLIGIVHSNIDY